MTSVKNRFLPPSFVSNLQDVLKNRKMEETPAAGEESAVAAEAPEVEATAEEKICEEDVKKEEDSRPIVLVTNEDGIEAPGLRCLVEALVGGGRLNVHVCAPESDKSGSGHCVTLRQTLVASSVDIKGSTAYEVSGTPVDCVSLGLSGALFPWKKPALVISGINRGPSCGYHIIYSGTVAAAREALISGVPSIAVSLNWKKAESSDSDFKEAAEVCLPLIYAAVQDIEKDQFPKGCLLNVDIPTCPSANKGFKLTRQSTTRSNSTWQPVTLHRHMAGQYMSKEQSLGIQLAQLSRAASAAGAARRLNSLRKNIEVESVGESGKPDTPNAVKKYFRAEFSEPENGEMGDDLDYTALQEGFITITPLGLTCDAEVDVRTSTACWIKTVIDKDVPTSL
uniref:Survival protein SurE-like phosphatase/nucleotidase domain-containing protein n=1 Tax=Araucaria cunninghamii TaxID=56994 RepID=A0A0D6R0X8_ARACU